MPWRQNEQGLKIWMVDAAKFSFALHKNQLALVPSQQHMAKLTHSGKNHRYVSRGIINSLKNFAIPKFRFDISRFDFKANIITNEGVFLSNNTLLLRAFSVATIECCQ